MLLFHSTISPHSMPFLLIISLYCVNFIALRHSKTMRITKNMWQMLIKAFGNMDVVFVRGSLIQMKRGKNIGWSLLYGIYFGRCKVLCQLNGNFWLIVLSGMLNISQNNFCSRLNIISHDKALHRWAFWNKIDTANKNQAQESQAHLQISIPGELKE